MRSAERARVEALMRLGGVVELRGPRGDVVAQLDVTPQQVRACDAHGKQWFPWKDRGNDVVLQHQHRVLATVTRGSPQ